MRALVPMKDAQPGFHILRLSAAFRLSHLLLTVPPSITFQAAADYDVFVEWELAFIIAGDRAAVAGLPTPEEVAHDITMCQTRPTWDTRPYGRPACPSEKAALDLQQQLYQSYGLHWLPRLGPGTRRRCLRPGEPSNPSPTTASATHGVSTP